MSNVSPTVPTPLTRSVRPADARLTAPEQPAKLPANLGRNDAVQLSGAAQEATAPQAAPFRSELVDRVRSEIASGAYEDTLDAKFDAILPALLEDIKNA